jgi:hypothetical protein
MTEPGFFTEPAIAINQRNPQQVVAAFQNEASVAYSVDGGRHWELASGVRPPNYRVSGDVSVAYDNQGHAIICYMAFDKLGTSNYWGHNSSRNGLFVRRSLDGGRTWEPEHVPIVEHPSAQGVPWEDKPYVISDTTRSRYAGTLYVGWTRWTLVDSEILFSRSVDGGRSWSRPVEIDDHPGLPRDDNGALEGFVGTVGADGTLYAVWSNRQGIAFTASRDGGRSFSHPRQIIDTAPPFFGLTSLMARGANGFPQIATEPRNGRIYVTWSDYRNGDVDVFCAASPDKGRSWSAPVRVNNDPVHNGVDQFFQRLAVDPIDGSVYVIFYDRRIDAANRKQIVVLARSSDGGRTFANYAWTDNPFEAGDIFFGDYIGIDAFAGRVYGVWTERPANGSGSGADGDSHRQQGTVIKVGVADFATAGSAPSSTKLPDSVLK